MRHANIAPVFRVSKPCATGANLNDWLAQQGLVALAQTFRKPASFVGSDDDFLDVTISGNWKSTVTTSGNVIVRCTGFLVMRGSGDFRVKRLCGRRKILIDSAGRCRLNGCKHGIIRPSRWVSHSMPVCDTLVSFHVLLY